MNINEIENFVEDKRKTIREFFDKIQKDTNAKIEINSYDDAYTVMLQLISGNLNIIDKLKDDLEKSTEDQEKIQIEDMIKDLMDSVTNQSWVAQQIGSLSNSEES